jgi:sporulation protein YlmC with PRC-barrel domain
MATQLEGMAPNLCTADEFRGKKVVDREGIEYGKVKHIHINPKTLTVSGVTIHQGFHRDYYLPTEYIDKFTEETLLLSRPPIRANVDVVDIDGHKIGKVKRLVKDNETNELQSIEIADGIMHTRIVAKSEIWGVGEKVILKLTKDQYKNPH